MKVLALLWLVPVSILVGLLGGAWTWAWIGALTGWGPQWMYWVWTVLIGGLFLATGALRTGLISPPPPPRADR